MIEPVTLLNGDALAMLRTLPSCSVHMCVTSPPYWGLRSYLPKDHDDKHREIGSEPTPEAFVETMVQVFREVRRVLHPSGTCWLNLGDSYASDGTKSYPPQTNTTTRNGERIRMHRGATPSDARANNDGVFQSGLKPKDLCGIPWMVMKALQQPYYTGKIRSEGDRRWLAALIDGEGSIYIARQKAGSASGRTERTQDNFDVGLDITNRNPALLHEAARIVGHGNVRENSNSRTGNRGQSFTWRIHSNKAREVLREVYPYLIGKQHEARLALACPSAGGLDYYEALKSLHKGGVPSLDAKAPESMFEPGWWVRSVICWHKKSCMPESVTDRPTNSWEPIFLLAKSARYFYDAEAVKEPADAAPQARLTAVSDQPGASARSGQGGQNPTCQGGTGSTRNQRNVWSLGPEPYSEAHFATFPTEIPRRAIAAGTSEKGCCPQCLAPWERVVEKPERMKVDTSAIDRFGNGSAGVHRKVQQAYQNWREANPDRTVGWQPTCKCDAGEPIPCTVLDPFAGAGTTLYMAKEMGRQAIGIELSPEYCRLIEKRCAQGVLALQENTSRVVGKRMKGESMPVIEVTHGGAARKVAE